MKAKTNNTTHFLNPTLGGRGAKTYKKPIIEWIPLDSEISLALESTPPEGPYESQATLPEHFNDSVLKSDLT